MSCILRLFKKQKQKPRQNESEKYSVTISLQDPLPETIAELYVLEDCLSKRMIYLNKKAHLAYSNAIYSQEKGSMRKYVAYMMEHKQQSDEARALHKRLTEIVEKQAELLYGLPPLVLPPP